MNKVRNILENRTTSGFPISVGLGLALETILMPTQDVIDVDRPVHKYSLKKGESLYLSLHTMVRAMLQSLTTDERNYIFKHDSIPEILQVLKSEAMVLESLLNQNGNTLVLLKENTNLLKKFDVIPPKNTIEGNIRVYSLQVDRHYKESTIFKGGKGLLMSTSVVDMLQNGSYKLLETHTGKIIPKTKFNSRYKQSKRFDLSKLPFNEELLRVYGDKYNVIRGLSTKEKIDVYNELVLRGVTPSKSSLWCKNVVNDVIKKRGKK